MVLSALRFALIAVLALRSTAILFSAARRQTPASRILIPLLVLLEIVLVGGQVVTRVAGAVAIAGLDLVLVGFALWTVVQVHKSRRDMYPEAALENALLAYFPRPFAKVAAIELTIVASAFRAFPYAWNVQRYGLWSYVETAKIRFLVFVLPITIVPDVIFLHLVLPSHLLWLKLLLDLLEVYACLWVLGLYATMVARPHAIVDGGNAIRIHRGILNSTEIRRDTIEAIAPLGAQRGFGIRSRAGEARLTVGGVPAVSITLKSPVAIVSLFAKTRMATKLLVATDAPLEFCRQLSPVVAR